MHNTWNHAKVVAVDALYLPPGTPQQFTLEFPDGKRVAVPAGLEVADGDRVIVIRREEWERRVNANDIAE